MKNARDVNDVSLKDTWCTKSAAVTKNANQVGIEVHADKLYATNRYREIAAKPTYMFNPTVEPQTSGLREVYSEVDAEIVVAGCLIHKPS